MERTIGLQNVQSCWLPIRIVLEKVGPPNLTYRKNRHVVLGIEGKAITIRLSCCLQVVESTTMCGAGKLIFLLFLVI